MRQSAYHRSLQTSIADRVWNWIWEHFLSFLEGVRGIPGGRYIALSAAALLVLVVILRLVYGAQLRDEERTRIRHRHGSRTYIDPWLEAQNAAAQGRFTDAAHALNAAVLERLTRRERIRLHESKTHGDYARELRSVGSNAYGPFRDFGRLYERIIYGRGECDAAGYGELMERARPLVSQSVAA